MAAKRCKGKTKLGKRCRATPRRDTGYCNAHSPKEVQDKAGFGGPQPGAGRPTLPRPHARMRERIEAELDTILAPYFEAINHAVLSANHQGEVVMSEHPDLGARIAAAERLLDRVYGKPKQQVEVGGGDSPIEAAIIGADASEMADAAHEFLRHLLPKE